MKELCSRVYNVLKIRADLFFGMAFIIELLILVGGFSVFEIPFRGRLTHIAFGLFGVKILLTNYSKSEWLLIASLGLIGTISYLAIDDEWVLRIVVMVIASKGVAVKRIITGIFITSLVGYLLVIGLSLVGVGGEITSTADFGRGGMETRWCLGFSHANNLHGTLWYVISLGLLLVKEKFRWYHAGLLTIVNIGLYQLTSSRTGMLVAQIVIIGTLCYSMWPRIKEIKCIYWFGGIVTVFLVGVSIYSAAFGVKHNALLYKFSQFLTDRLESLTWWEDFYSWRLFGADFAKEPVDIGFITIVSDYGYVILALYLFCIFTLIHDCMVKKKWVEYLVLMTCVFYTFMESTYVINVPLLCNFTFVLLLGTWNTFFKRDNSVCG